MVDVKDIEKLAVLARIKIADDEKVALTKEIDSILAYVDQIKKATVALDPTPALGSVYNVMREDVVVTTSREDREALLDEAPQKEGNFIAVKKIIAQD